MYKLKSIYFTCIHFLGFTSIIHFLVNTCELNTLGRYFRILSYRYRLFSIDTYVNFDWREIDSRRVMDTCQIGRDKSCSISVNIDVRVATSWSQVASWKYRRRIVTRAGPPRCQDNEGSYLLMTSQTSLFHDATRPQMVYDLTNSSRMADARVNLRYFWSILISLKVCLIIY